MQSNQPLSSIEAFALALVEASSRLPVTAVEATPPTSPALPDDESAAAGE